MALSLRDPSASACPESPLVRPMQVWGHFEGTAPLLCDGDKTRRLHPPASPVTFCLVSTPVSCLLVLLLLVQGAGAPLY